MPTHKNLEIQIMNMRNFTPRANKSIKILVKKNVGNVNNSVINEFACTVEFWFRYYTKLGKNIFNKCYTS